MNIIAGKNLMINAGFFNFLIVTNLNIWVIRILKIKNRNTFN